MYDVYICLLQDYFGANACQSKSEKVRCTFSLISGLGEERERESLRPVLTKLHSLLFAFFKKTRKVYLSDIRVSVLAPIMLPNINAEVVHSTKYFRSPSRLNCNFDKSQSTNLLGWENTVGSLLFSCTFLSPRWIFSDFWFYILSGFFGFCLYTFRFCFFLYRFISSLHKTKIFCKPNRPHT